MVLATNITNKKIVAYVEKQAKDNFITKSKVLNNLILKDYYLNHNIIENSVRYELDTTTNTMKLLLPSELVDALNLTEDTVLVNLK